MSWYSFLISKTVNCWLHMKSVVINAWTPIVAVVDKMIELDLNNLFLIPNFVTFTKELFNICPFSLISSILNHEIVPSFQKRMFDFEGV